jgi:hypothetical protein
MKILVAINSFKRRLLDFTAEASKNNNGFAHVLSQEWPNYGY